MSDFVRGLRFSEDWKKAEQWFGYLHQKSSFSLFGGAVGGGSSFEDTDYELEGILALCPRFFPALLARGFLLMQHDKVEKGERILYEGLTHLVELSLSSEELVNALPPIVENLENLLRYDLAVPFLEKAIQYYPEEHALYDELAYFYLNSPKIDNGRALQMQNRALDMDPGNDYYLNNLGWIKLKTGYLNEAEICIRKALEFDTDNENYWGNLETLEYMKEHRLNYTQYLLREVGRSEFDELDMLDFEDQTEACGKYNKDRIEAFKYHLLEKDELNPHEILDKVACLEGFTSTIEQHRSAEHGPFLFENPEMFLNPLRLHMVNFIFNSLHIESDYLIEVGKAFGLFYRYLGEVNLISPGTAKQFESQFDSLTNEFSGKLEEYYRLNHDINIDDNEREERIDRLFGMFENQ